MKSFVSETSTVKLIFVLQVGSTLAMFGVIWFVQLVHYPLFGRVGTERFAAYQAEQERRTAWVTTPLMPLEGLTAILLLWWRPEGVSLALVWIGLILLAVIWLSTAFFQVPQHRRLEEGFAARAHRLLVASNWVRTAGWSARAALVLWMTARALR